MIEKLHLTNFQGISDVTSIPLAPLTLVFGPNSSGKSSIIRSLLLLQQSFSWSNAATQPEFVFSDRNGIDLGSFANTVHKHDQSKEMVFCIEVSDSDKAFSDGSAVWIDAVEMTVGADSLVCKPKFFGTMERMGHDVDYFQFDFVQDKGKLQEVDADPIERSFGHSRWRLTADSEKKFREIAAFTPIETFGAVQRGQIGQSGKLLSIQESIEALGDEFNDELVDKIIEVRQKPLSWRMGAGLTPRLLRPSLNSIRTLFTDEKQAARASIFARNIAFRDFGALAELLEAYGSSLMRRFNLSKMMHVEAMRPIPERLEIGSGEGSRHLETEQSMETVSDWVSKLTDDCYELGFIEMQGELVDLVGKSGTLVLKDKKLKTTVTFQDVGVGLSQVLPVLRVLEKVSSTKEPRVMEIRRRSAKSTPSTVLLEQPELHLHPRMQGKLMEIIVDYLLRPGAAQIIAETHSESMVLKVQSEVSKGRLSADAVSILYVWKDAEFGNTRVKRLSLTDKGEFIDEWPESFSKIRLTQMRGE